MSEISAEERRSFASKYGPWGLVAGASDGVGAALADGLAQRGLNVVLLARRQETLDEVASQIERRHGVDTRTLVVDLSESEAASTVVEGVAHLDVGFVAYCAGADPSYRHFLDQPLDDAESMLHRNCTVPMQICHHLAAPMVRRGRGGIVIFGSGAGFAGAPNMVAYAATKAFDMVFAEALHGELAPSGVDVLGLILGETDTPSLRRLKISRGLHDSMDRPVKGAASVESVVEEAFANLDNGPTRLANTKMRWGMKLFFPVPRNRIVKMMSAASVKTMGSDPAAD